MTPEYELKVLEKGPLELHEEDGPVELSEELNLALRTLALPPWEQAEMYPPSEDITFRLVDDFRKAVGAREDSEHAATLNFLSEAIEEIPERDFEWKQDNIESVLFMPSWDKVRTRARVVLKMMRIELGAVPRPVA